MGTNEIAKALAICVVMLKSSGCIAQADSVCKDDPVAYDSIFPARVADDKRREPAQSGPYEFKPTQLIVPGVLVGIGLIGLGSDWLKSQDRKIRNELQANVGGRIHVDDFFQYAPMATSYGLNLCGIKGKHGYADLTVILGTAYALMGSTVYALKAITKVERPDGSARNSFPSGHTATAFMGAELLRKEYWNVSPWIGVAGYAIAMGTGFLRMYNDRHWLTDVIAGAGFGILSVQAAYWLYPVISRALFHKQGLNGTCISPFLSGAGKGLSCMITF